MVINKPPPPSPAGILFFGGLCVGAFGLGVWQTRRFFEKQQQTQQRQANLALEPTQHLGSAAFRRTLVTGTFRHDCQVLVGPRSAPNTAKPQGLATSPMGYLVVTPLERASHGPVLVNRGWVPRNVQEWDQSTTSRTMQVVAGSYEQPRYLVADHDFQKKPPAMYWYDAEALQAYMKECLKNESDADLPYVMALQQPADPEDDSKLWKPLPPTLESIAQFKVTPSVHAGYAVTWFGLSLAGVVLTRKWMRRPR